MPEEGLEPRHAAYDPAPPFRRDPFGSTFDPFHSGIEGVESAPVRLRLSWPVLTSFSPRNSRFSSKAALLEIPFFGPSLLLSREAVAQTARYWAGESF